MICNIFITVNNSHEKTQTISELMILPSTVCVYIELQRGYKVKVLRNRHFVGFGLYINTSIFTRI